MAQSSRRCYCSVPLCSNSKQKHPYLSFHDFPVDKRIRALWVKAIKREEGPTFKILRGSTYVCSQHFAPEDIYTSASGRIRIKQGAVPSRFHWNDSERLRQSAYQRDRKRLCAAALDEYQGMFVPGDGTEQALPAGTVSKDHDNAYHPCPEVKFLTEAQSRKLKKMATVTIKEEPLEIDVKQEPRLLVDGETQTCYGIKQEGPGAMESRAQQSEEETSLSTASESEDEAAEDDLGEMAVVTIKEEMLECESEDSESEDDRQLECDSEDSFQSNVMTEEAAEVSEPERHGSIVKTTLDGARRIYQGNRLKSMQSKDPQSDKILSGENAHKQNELTEGLYICSDCGKDFFGESELKSHQKSHRLGSTKSDSDPFALKAASNYQVTSQEVRLPFRCSHCDKGFARKGQLNRHEFIHSGQKPFSCSDCGKCFGNKWQLSAHQKIHTGEKPYSCTFCEKCFIRKGELTVHLKRHTGDKPFNCSFCGKGFTTKGEVNIHQRRHVGEKTIGLSHPSSLAARAQLS